MKIISSGRGIHTPEFHKRKKREKRIKWILIVLCLIIFVAVPFYLLRTPKFLITNIEVRGNGVTQTEEIEQIVMDKLAGKYLWLFPKSNAVLYPKSGIRQSLLQNIPRLSAVEVELSNPRTISINLVERQPFALYCKDVVYMNSPEGCFFLDQTGYIFSEAPSFSGGVYTVYTSEPVMESPLRQTYLEEDVFLRLEPFIKGVEQAGLRPKVFIKKSEELNLRLESGAVIMWKATADLETILSDLESFLSDKNFTKEPRALERIIYIDLRFGNKVFYKFEDL
jgi:hypothetical protein